MLNKTIDKNQAQAKLLPTQQMFKLKISKFMHKFLTVSCQKLLKNILLKLNKYTAIQLHCHETKITSHRNIT